MKTAAACAAFIMALVAAFPAQAANPYVACVQNQLTALGYNPGPIDGLMGGRTRSAMQAVRPDLPDSERISLLPPLRQSTAIHWCRELAHDTPSLGQFMPSRQGPVLGFENEGLRSPFDLALRDVTGFFRQEYQIELAGRVGLALGKSPKAIARKIYAMRAQLPLRLRGIETAARDRCAPDKVGGLAMPDRAFVCLPWAGLDTNRLRPHQKRIMTAVLAHEYAHLVQAELSGWRSNPYVSGKKRSLMGPHWLVEGSAQLVEERLIEQLTGRPRLSIALLHTETGGEKTALRQLRASRSVDTSPEYRLALYATYLLAQRVGDQAVLDFWRHLGAGKSWETAFRDVFGMELAEFETTFETLRGDLASAFRFAKGI